MARITRAQWGAGAHRAPVIGTPVRDLFLHHTVTPTWTGAAAARSVQQIALQRGFIDISYSWLVDVRGNEIEGRGWRRQGGHTAGHNSTGHAISLVGNFETSPMTQPMIRAVARLAHEHRAFGPGRITRPHSAVGSTACPGVHARNQIANINAIAGSDSAGPPPGGAENMPLSASDKQWIQGAIRSVLNEGSSSGTWASQTRADASHLRKTRTAVEDGLEAKRLASITRGVLNEGASDGTWSSNQRANTSHLRKVRELLERLVG